MRVPPDIYSKVILFQLPRADPTKAVVGGISDPDLALSNLLAARYVLEQGEEKNTASEVVMPASYLQRHAWELQLKKLIEYRYLTVANLAWLNAPQDRRPEEREAEATHDLGRLLRTMQGLVEVPSTIIEVTGKLLATERSQPALFRYLRQRDGTRSFEEPTELDPISIQYELEEVFRDYLVEDYHRPTLERPDTWATTLGREMIASDDEVHAMIRSRLLVARGP